MERDINRVVIDAESFVTTFADGGRTPREVRVRPSGDDAKAIKIWVDLGPGVNEAACDAWAEAAKAALAKVTTGYSVEVRAESI